MDILIPNGLIRSNKEMDIKEDERLNKRKVAARVMAAMMTAAMLPQSALSVYAEEPAGSPAQTDEGVYLGTSIIADPKMGGSSGWSGSYVNYGTYNGQAVKYRVLDAETTDYGSTSMLLDCDSVLWHCGNFESMTEYDHNGGLCSAFHKWISSESHAYYNNVWATCDLQTVLNEEFLSDDYFSDAEQEAIVTSTKAGDEPIAGDKIFILEYSDYLNKSYGYGTYPTITKSNPGNAYGYWIRDELTSTMTSAYFWNLDSGTAKLAANSTCHGGVGVSPAMNIDPSKVLFTTVVDGTAGEPGATYALTLVDEDLTVAVTENQEATRKGKEITVPYTLGGNNKDDATSIALMILDKEYSATGYDGNVLAYLTGKVNDKGEITYTLPDDVTIPENAYYYLTAIGKEAGEDTGSASALVQLAIEGGAQPADDKEAPADTTVREACHHRYEWDTVRKGTATTDGLMRYRCKYCGTVEYEVPIAAYYIYNKETQESILQAAPNATVAAQTPVFISFHEMVKDALQERPDVTLLVDYRSGGKDYEMTIPAGSGDLLENLFGESQYAGYLYLGGAFATVER